MKAETQEGQRIETIQEEIEKVESDIFRKSHYTRQLEHMLLRLQKNQVSTVINYGDGAWGMEYGAFNRIRNKEKERGKKKRIREGGNR